MRLFGRNTCFMHTVVLDAASWRSGSGELSESLNLAIQFPNAPVAARTCTNTSSNTPQCTAAFIAVMKVLVQSRTRRSESRRWSHQILTSQLTG